MTLPTCRPVGAAKLRQAVLPQHRHRGLDLAEQAAAIARIGPTPRSASCHLAGVMPCIFSQNTS